MRTPLSNLSRETTSRSISALLATLALACGLAAGQDDKPRTDTSGFEFAKAPAVAASWANPYAGQGRAVQAGKKLFDRHCADCHGAEGGGSERGPKLAGSEIQTAPPGVVFWFLKNGDLKEGMPAWSRLPDQRLWQLVSYLQTLAAEEHPTENQPGAVRPKDSSSRP